MKPPEQPKPCVYTRVQRALLERAEELLGLDSVDIEALYEGGDLPAAIAVTAALDARHRSHVAAHPTTASAVIDALEGACGVRDFQCGPLLRSLEDEPTPRRLALLATVRNATVGDTETDLNAQRFGRLLDRLEGLSSNGYTLRRTSRRNGSAVWQLVAEGDQGD